MSKERLVLERVVGHGVVSSEKLSSSSATDDIAQVHGSIITLGHPRRFRPSHILVPPGDPPPSLSSVSLSPCGTVVATAPTRTARNPSAPLAVLWALSYRPPRRAVLRSPTPNSLTHVALGGCMGRNGPHKHVLVGCGSDALVVWIEKDTSWIRSCRGKFAMGSSPSSLALTKDGKTAVTAAKGKLLFWGIDDSMEDGTIRGRPVRFGRGDASSLRNHSWVGVSCGDDNVVALSKEGALCVFAQKNRCLLRWVDVKIKEAASFALHEPSATVAVGGSKGTIRIFDGKSLAYKGTLPTRTTNSIAALSVISALPIRTSISVSESVAFMGGSALSVVAWDKGKEGVIIVDIPGNVTSLSTVRVRHTSHSHPAAVWDMQLVPREDKSETVDIVTACDDGCLRWWSMQPSRKGVQWTLEHSLVIHSKIEDGIESHGLRCIWVAPSGRWLAIGDSMGNVFGVCKKEVSRWGDKPDCSVAAHDGEVRALGGAVDKKSRIWLGSGSRDRIVHIYHVNIGDGSCFLRRVQTWEDHTASVTALRFSKDATKCISAAADATLSFRVFDESSGLYVQQNVASCGSGAVYDLQVGVQPRYVISAGQDRKLRIWNWTTAKVVRTYRTGSMEPLCLMLDPSGIFAAVGGSDRRVRLLDFFSGDSVAVARGHGEVVTSVLFTPDGKRMLSASPDGLVFVWRLPQSCIKQITDRMEELDGSTVPPSVAREATPPPPPVTPPKWPVQGSAYKEQRDNIQQLLGIQQSPSVPQDDDIVTFQYSENVLPSWVKKFQSGTEVSSPHVDAPIPLMGRWAERLEAEGYRIISEDPNDVLVVDPITRRQYTLRPDAIDKAPSNYDDVRASLLPIGDKETVEKNEVVPNEEKIMAPPSEVPSGALENVEENGEKEMVIEDVEEEPNLDQYVLEGVPSSPPPSIPDVHNKMKSEVELSAEGQAKEIERQLFTGEIVSDNEDVVDAEVDKEGSVDDREEDNLGDLEDDADDINEDVEGDEMDAKPEGPGKEGEAVVYDVHDDNEESAENAQSEVEDDDEHIDVIGENDHEVAVARPTSPDVLKRDFHTLREERHASHSHLRLSLTALYRENVKKEGDQHDDVTTGDEPPPTGMKAAALAEWQTSRLREKKEALAKEVERTRERLRKMGLLPEDPRYVAQPEVGPVQQEETKEEEVKKEELKKEENIKEEVIEDEVEEKSGETKDNKEEFAPTEELDTTGEDVVDNEQATVTREENAPISETTDAQGKRDAEVVIQDDVKPITEKEVIEVQNEEDVVIAEEDLKKDRDVTDDFVSVPTVENVVENAEDIVVDDGGEIPEGPTSGSNEEGELKQPQGDILRVSSDTLDEKNRTVSTSILDGYDASSEKDEEGSDAPPLMLRVESSFTEFPTVDEDDHKVDKPDKKQNEEIVESTRSDAKDTVKDENDNVNQVKAVSGKVEITKPPNVPSEPRESSELMGQLLRFRVEATKDDGKSGLMAFLRDHPSEATVSKARVEVALTDVESTCDAFIKSWSQLTFATESLDGEAQRRLQNVRSRVMENFGLEERHKTSEVTVQSREGSDTAPSVNGVLADAVERYSQQLCSIVQERLRESVVTVLRESGIRR